MPRKTAPVNGSSVDVWGPLLLDMISDLYDRAEAVYFNVKAYGAVGDGVTDDTTAILAALADAKLAPTGGILYFPPGKYLLSSPIVLPRTGVSPTAVVTVQGSGTTTTTITGGAGFPTNRAMIEWEAVTSRAWGQAISRLTMRAPNVVGTRAIWYAKNAPGTTLTDFNNERMQICMLDVNLEGNNGYHSSLAKFEGQVFYSAFERVRGDNALSAVLGGYSPITDVDTVTIEFDSNLYGTLPSSDILGLSYGWIKDCSGGSLRRGGRGVLVRGKLKDAKIVAGWCDGGRYDAGIDLINSFSVVIENSNNEGRSAAQIRLKDCHSISIDQVVLSAQDPEFPDWTASTAYTTGWGVVVPGWRSNTTVVPSNANWYKCTVAGTSGSTQPTWPTTVGATVTDGGVTWQCMGPACNDALIIDGGRNNSLDRVGVGPQLPNFSARGCKMLRNLNSPVNVDARRCVAPDNPVNEVAWAGVTGMGQFFGNRNGEYVQFGSITYTAG